MMLDTMTKLIADRTLSRRSALKGGATGLAATAGALTLGRVAAQDDIRDFTIPPRDLDDPHSSAVDAAPAPEFLFVQSFAGGTWGPKAGEEGVYTLTLTGASANTIYFSDRPQRIFGLSPTQDFLEGLGFTPTNPPNAALVARREDGAEELLVIELLNPAYDEMAGTLTYDALVLADYSDHGLAHAAAQQTGYELTESFGHGGLFIDDCPDQPFECWGTTGAAAGQLVGSVKVGACYDPSISHGFMLGACIPCRDPKEICAEKWGDCSQRYEQNGFTWVDYTCDARDPAGR